MKEFEYKVSVIVPVYNVERYLRDCLDSLLHQTMPQDEMEILLINDGSTDNSYKICQEYADLFSVFKLFSKENEGLSATRNYGINRAKGKYLMYIDSDDTLALDTVKEVTDFFDTVYDEVDLVTYLDQGYKNGKKLPLHYRYNYLNKSGVYDLNKYPFICQTRVSICVKNLLENNFMFDTTPGFIQEDQEYCSKVLMEKQKIGFCSKGEYCYNRSNEGSIVSVSFHAFYLFEKSLAYFENLFAQFEDIEVPKYYQNMYLSDLIWKLEQNVLWPHHYDKKRFEESVQRIKKLLGRVDNEIIYNHPSLDNFQKQYWLDMKPNTNPVVYAEPDGIRILVDGKIIYMRKNIEIILHKIRVENGKANILGFVKSPIYTYFEEKAEIYVIENDMKRTRLDVDTSIHSYYRSDTKTCNFYRFNMVCDTSVTKKLYFEIKVDGLTYETVFWCMPTAVFNSSLGIDSYIRENTKITLNDNVLSFSNVEKEEIETFDRNQSLKYKDDSAVYNLRLQSIDYRKYHNVWLYYDLYTVKKDNAYYQFLSDFKKKDGIERYYVYSCDLSEIIEQFTEEQRKYLVPFGSEKHKLLYLSAKMVLTAFYGFSTISPFETETNEAKFKDLIRFETIYLQHGVLHANLRLKNCVERCRAEKIVVSSYFEKDIYTKHYGYRAEDIISVGMARYDLINRDKKPQRRILFAPSWRQYLTNVVNGAQWDVVMPKLMKSNYFAKIMEFLNDARLAKYLADNDLILEFKPHPIFGKTLSNALSFETDRIQIANENVDIEDYLLFITDFSSFVYDFACLARPIIYFVPDLDEFKSGMNHYRELELPFEKAFGNMITEAEEAVLEVQRIGNRGFLPDKVYKERMEEFFVPLDDCREKLYSYIVQSMKKK